MTLEIKNGCSVSFPRVAILPWPELENCYLVLSANWRNDTKENSTPAISFTYERNGVAADWDGELGPITIWKKSEKNGNDGEHDPAQMHWLWPWATGRGNWSQLAVNREGLPDAFVNGSYAYIFDVLKSFVEA